MWDVNVNVFAAQLSDTAFSQQLPGCGGGWGTRHLKGFFFCVRTYLQPYCANSMADP